MFFFCIIIWARGRSKGRFGKKGCDVGVPLLIYMIDKASYLGCPVKFVVWVFLVSTVVYSSHVRELRTLSVL